MSFKEINIEELCFNPFTAINKDWMLITAGDEKSYNTMTASWGALGELWGHYSSTVYIRPQRYTKEFVDRSEYYSLCFFSGEYREALSFCGSKSGRDYDKALECGLTPAFDCQAPYFREASMVYICRKLYKQDMTADCFVDKEVMKKCYPESDFHTTYVGAIETILTK